MLTHIRPSLNFWWGWGGVGWGGTVTCALDGDVQSHQVREDGVRWGGWNNSYRDVGDVDDVDDVDYAREKGEM